ncbi:MAG: ABC transporter permease, partial [Chloroflexi bacterium]|nr:ABC transporter permease [Chloroflexota bacterium]
VRKLGFYLVTLWIAVTLNFVIPRLMPGDPATAMFAQFQGRMTPQELQALRATLGFTNDNIFKQYLTYLWNLLHGNLGISFSHYPIAVRTVIGQDLPWTLLLVGIAVFISFIVGTLSGIYAAWKRGSRFDNTMPPILLFWQAFPPFYIGLALIFFVALKAGWFPLGHAYSFGTHISLTFGFIGSVLYHAAMPVFVLVLTTLGGWALGMRNNMVASLGEEYITMAEAKGLSPRRVMLNYAARNAILPQVTSFALALGYIVSGQILIETVFSYPGVGYDLTQAATEQDYPLLQGLLLFIVVAVLIANLLADLIYVRLDPRVAAER